MNGECDAPTIVALQAFQEKVLGWSGRAVDATVRFALLSPASGGICSAA